MDCSLLLLLLLCCFVLPTSTTPAKPKAIRQGFTKESGTPKLSASLDTALFYNLPIVQSDAPSHQQVLHQHSSSNFISFTRAAHCTWVWYVLLSLSISALAAAGLFHRIFRYRRRLLRKQSFSFNSLPWVQCSSPAGWTPSIPVASTSPCAAFSVTGQSQGRIFSQLAHRTSRAHQLSNSLSDFFESDNYSNTSLLLLPPPLEAMSGGEYTIVLDMDETLLTSRLRKPLFVSSKVKLLELTFEDGTMWSLVRPGAQELIQSLAPRCELVMWTSGVEEYASRAMRHVDPEGGVRHSIYRDEVWLQLPRYVKELRRLGRPMDRVLLVENSPFVCVNPENTILVADFMGRPYDSVLPRLLIVLNGLLDSNLPVPQFLALCAEYGLLAFHKGRYWLPDES